MESFTDTDREMAATLLRIREHNERLKPLIDRFTRAAVEAMNDDYQMVEIIQALGTVASSGVFAVTNPESLATVQAETTKNYETLLSLFEKNQVGIGTAVGSQLAAQAQVLSFMASAAVEMIKQAKAEEEDTHDNDAGN